MTINRDFSGQDLRNRSFEGQDLRGADFSNSDLRGCNFKDTQLVSATFERAQLGQSPEQAAILTALTGSIWACLAGLLTLTIGVAINDVEWGSNMIGTILNGVADLYKSPIIFIMFSAVIILSCTATFIGDGDFLSVNYILLGFYLISFFAGIAFEIVIRSFNEGRVIEEILGLIAFIILVALSRYGMEKIIKIMRQVWGTSFRNADLTHALFRDTKAHSVVFKNSNRDWVDWEGAEINRVDFSITPVFQLQTDRSTGRNRSYVRVNFQNKILNNALLQEANLCSAKLSGAKFQDSDFSGANLTKIKALGTDFSGSNFTGAIIQSWEIDQHTNFGRVSCDYVYLSQDKNPSTRRPVDGCFSSGEFARWMTSASTSCEWGVMIQSNGQDDCAPE